MIRGSRCDLIIEYVVQVYNSTYGPCREGRGVPGMTGPPNSFTARGPVTLTAILFPRPAV